MPLTPGTRLGSYEIVEPIGAGGMGEVYRAWDPKLTRLVAIKVLPAHLASDGAALARFEREARAVAALSHPNILGIYDFGTEGEVAFAVMELLEGPRRRAVEPRDSRDTGRPILRDDLLPDAVVAVPGGRLALGEQD